MRRVGHIFIGHFPRLTRKKNGFRLSEISEKKNNFHLSPDQVPDSVSEIGDTQNLISQVFWDDKYHRPFKISEADIAFARKMSVPLPNSYYMNHIQENFSWMPFNGELRDCSCGKCQKKIQTAWSEKYASRVLCEDCYQEKMY